jgi:hypothetical protein
MKYKIGDKILVKSFVQLQKEFIVTYGMRGISSGFFLSTKNEAHFFFLEDLTLKFLDKEHLITDIVNNTFFIIESNWVGFPLCFICSQREKEFQIILDNIRKEIGI